MTTMNEELLPCPFCGGEAKQDNGYDGGSFITCTECLASSAIEYDRKETLARRWNRRAGAVERVQCKGCDDGLPVNQHGYHIAASGGATNICQRKELRGLIEAPPNEGAQDPPPADTERLNWMERVAYGTGKALTLGGSCYWSVSLGRKRLGEGDDLREAIDAAIEDGAA